MLDIDASQNQCDQALVKISQSVKDVDAALHAAVNGIEILDAIAPINYKQEKTAFFASNFTHDPKFAYKQQTFDAFGLKRNLFNLPVESMGDSDLVHLYKGVIDSFIDKIDQVASIGTPEFLYNSFRYFGEPSEKDIKNAAFVLHLPYDKPTQEDLLDANSIEKYLRNFALEMGYEHSVKLDENMIANALVSGTTVKINTQAKVNKIDMKALAHHELGVHLVSTLNGRKQGLKVLSLGCPANTKTQEGLAILSEFMAGCLTVGRLRNLALRVMAVSSMIKERSFKNTFLMLKEEYSASEEQAFTITARVYRGGGFTKDYVYLRGFHEMLNAFEHEPTERFNRLLCGKVAVEYLPVVNRLVDKGYLLSLGYITPSFVAPNEADSIQTFIAHAIK
uniref:flavohemoglobin expression-modulating QEGLA motif protein n=1 Tax=Ningiella ruwaisensis TaxID=2364274 RepID=UPI0010A04C25|nr:flavohemoglobin expression-modulating QEGLA motif protein [Ningiella ruwaisensis]